MMRRALQRGMGLAWGGARSSQTSQVVGDSERLLSSLHATSSAGGPEWAREPWARLLRWRGRAFSSGGGRGTKEVPKREGRKGDAGAGETRPPPQETPVAPGAGKGSTSYTRPITWGSVAAVLGATYIFYRFAFLERKEEVMRSIPKQGAVGRAAVGGPFELVDTEGKPFTDKDLLGNFALIYFGFTFCPDICPDELDKITEGINLADKAVSQVPVTPVFISVDPERDTPAAVKAYLKDFHPRFVGLTGTMEQVKKAARAYRVYFHKTNEEKGDYLVDHSIIMYMIDPNGDFLTFFGRNNTAEDIADVIRKNIRAWRMANPNWRPGERGRVRQETTGERQAPMRPDPQ